MVQVSETSYSEKTGGIKVLQIISVILTIIYGIICTISLVIAVDAISKATDNAVNLIIIYIAFGVVFGILLVLIAVFESRGKSWAFFLQLLIFSYELVYTIVTLSLNFIALLFIALRLVVYAAGIIINIICLKIVSVDTLKLYGKIWIVIGIVIGAFAAMLMFVYCKWAFFETGSYKMSGGTIQMYPFGNCVYSINETEYKGSYAPADYNPLLNEGQYIITIPEQNVEILVTRNGEEFKELSREHIPTEGDLIANAVESMVSELAKPFS